jgi:hypothetical protein
MAAAAAAAAAEGAGTLAQAPPSSPQHSSMVQATQCQARLPQACLLLQRHRRQLPAWAALVAPCQQRQQRQCQQQAQAPACPQPLHQGVPVGVAAAGVVEHPAGRQRRQPLEARLQSPLALQLHPCRPHHAGSHASHACHTSARRCYPVVAQQQAATGRCQRAVEAATGRWRQHHRHRLLAQAVSHPLQRRAGPHQHQPSCSPRRRRHPRSQPAGRHPFTPQDSQQQQARRQQWHQPQRLRCPAAPRTSLQSAWHSGRWRARESQACWPAAVLAASAAASAALTAALGSLWASRCRWLAGHHPPSSAPAGWVAAAAAPPALLPLSSSRVARL